MLKEKQKNSFSSKKGRTVVEDFNKSGSDMVCGEEAWQVY